jgi:hypothetical protein
MKRYTPFMVKKRKLILDSIVQKLTSLHFKNLDETNSDDLQKIIRIVSDMYPESNSRKIKEYSEIAIRLWKKTKTTT